MAEVGEEEVLLEGGEEIGVGGEGVVGEGAERLEKVAQVIRG